MATKKIRLENYNDTVVIILPDGRMMSVAVFYDGNDNKVPDLNVMFPESLTLNCFDKPGTPAWSTKHGPHILKGQQIVAPLPRTVDEPVAKPSPKPVSPSKPRPRPRPQPRPEPAPIRTKEPAPRPGSRLAPYSSAHPAPKGEPDPFDGSGVCAKCTRSVGKHRGYRFTQNGYHTKALDIPAPCFVCHPCIDAVVRTEESKRHTREQRAVKRPATYSNKTVGYRPPRLEA